jgi:hypothetical protein
VQLLQLLNGLTKALQHILRPWKQLRHHGRVLLDGSHLPRCLLDLLLLLLL